MRRTLTRPPQRGEHNHLQMRLRHGPSCTAINWRLGAPSSTFFSLIASFLLHTRKEAKGGVAFQFPLSLFNPYSFGDTGSQCGALQTAFLETLGIFTSSVLPRISSSTEWQEAEGQLWVPSNRPNPPWCPHCLHKDPFTK